jgi:hypothetical protein
MYDLLGEFHRYDVVKDSLLDLDKLKSESEKLSLFQDQLADEKSIDSIILSLEGALELLEVDKEKINQLFECQRNILLIRMLEMRKLSEKDKKARAKIILDQNDVEKILNGSGDD